MELFFSGNQPESCEIYYQFVRMFPGGRYVMRYQYRTVGLPDRTGLRWSFGAGQSYEFLASPEWAEGEWRWQAGMPAGRLILSYRRNSGSTRHQGTVLIRQIRLDRDETGGP